MCAIQKLKTHLIVHYSNATSFIKGRTGSTLSRTKYVKCFSVETRCYRLVLRLNFIGLWNYCTIKWKVSPGSAVNLNKLNLTETELFIRMLYGDWSSLQPDHETNKSPRRMQVNPPARKMTDRLS